MAVETRVGRQQSARYGWFSEDGREFIINRHDTPRPWINVLTNEHPGYGMVISQAGGGYSWLGNAELNRITLWSQDLIQDNHGKFIYIRDNESGEFWSAAYQPVGRTPEEYECRHGAGYTVISSVNHGVRSRITFFVPPDEPLEIWLVELEDIQGRPRQLSLISYLEWSLGTAHDTHREFHRTFTETSVEPETGAILARKRLWAIGNSKGQGWNREWEGTGFHASSMPPSGFECDREAFIGMYRSLASPRAVETGVMRGTEGKWLDPMASLKNDVTLPAGGSVAVAFTLGAAGSDESAIALARRYANVAEARSALQTTKDWWRAQLEPFHVDTPDADLNALLNTWLPYQAMAGRMWGRTAYYQAGGAYGFRDQLQDSHIFLPSWPDRTKKQILLHAAHQFVAGNVFHWWQPITETGAPSRYSDDLLWLPFVLGNYIRETGDWAILGEQAPYVDAPAESLAAHCFRAIDLSLSRFSERGLPLIGEGDWNDGLSAAGWEGKGESVWVGFFLRVILPQWALVAERLGDPSRAEKYRCRSEKLLTDLNSSAWDGDYYFGATCDDGTLIGSHESPEAKIFLNCQTWSIISGTCPPERQDSLMETTRRELYTEAGPVLLRPAYTQPDERIGYLTRYAPASRENGGVYVHAATWAIWCECLMGRPDKAWEIYTRISPAVRGRQPESYRAEPYVTAGNIDGPDSPNCGRGGWTWYTGSSAWLYRVMTERVLGVRPEIDGLRVSPRIPDHWGGFTMTRLFRGCRYHITVRRASGDGTHPGMLVDGKPVKGEVVPVFSDSSDHTVEVFLPVSEG